MQENWFPSFALFTSLLLHVQLICNIGSDSTCHTQLAFEYYGYPPCDHLQELEWDS